MSYTKIFNRTLLIFCLLVIVCHPVIGQKYKYTVITEGSDFNLCSAHTLRSMNVSVIKSDNTVTLIKSFASQPVPNIREVLYSATKLIGVKVDASFTRSINNGRSETVTQSYSWSSSGTRIVSGIYQGVCSGGGDCQNSILNGGQVVYLQMEPFYYFSEVNKRIACPGESLGLTLTNYDIPGVVNLQVKTPTSGWRDVKPLSVQPYTGIVNISLTDLSSAYAWTNQDLTFQIKYPDGTFSALFSGFAFLTTPQLTINPIKPTCSGDVCERVEISGFPANSSGKQLRIDVCKLSGTPVGDDAAALKVFYRDPQTLIPYYWNDQITKTGIDINSTTYILTNTFLEGSGMILDAGMFGLKVYYDGSPCSTDEYFEIKPPAPLSLKLTPVPIETNSTLHTKINGGTGSVTLTASGGKSGCVYQYRINTSSDWIPFSGSTITLSGLSDGDVIHLSNNFECAEDSKTVAFTQPATLALSEKTPTPPTCHDNNDASAATNRTNGSISFKITGGIAEYTVKLQKKNLSGTFEALSNTFVKDPITGVCTFSGLGQGIYNLVLSDAYSSETSNSVTSENLNLIPPEILATNPTPISLNCYGDKTTINITEDLSSTYVLEYKTSTAINYSTFTENSTELSADTYNIKVSDANRTCSELLTTTISQPTASLTIDTVSTTTDVCNYRNGSAIFKIAGGVTNDYPYRIVIIADGNLQPTVTYKDIVIGSGLNSIQFTGLHAATYTATLYSGYSNINSYHCSHSKRFTIKQSNPLSVISYNDIVKESCVDNFDAQITLTNLDKIVGDYTFTGGGTLDKSTHVINGLTSQAYVFTIAETTTTGRQCSTTVTVPVGKITVVEDPLHFNGIGYTSTASSCIGATNGTLTVSAGGVFKVDSYTLTNTQSNLPETNQNGLFGGKGAGIYSMTIKDEKGCTVTKQAEIEAGENPVKIFTATPTSQSCATVINGAIGLTGLGHAANKPLDIWLDDKLKGTIDSKTELTYTLPELSAGSYDVTVKDGDGCFAVQSDVKVGSDGHQPAISVAEKEKLACDGANNGRVLVSATTDYTTSSLTFVMLQSDNTPVVGVDQGNKSFEYSQLNKQSYTVTVTDGELCSNSKAITVSVGPALSIRLNDSDIVPASCQAAKNGQITVSASHGKPFEIGGYDFTFKQEVKRGTSSMFEGIEASTDSYSVLVTDAANCTASRPFILSVKSDRFEITSATPTPAKCQDSINGTITITANDWKVGGMYDYWLKVNDDTVDSGKTSSKEFNGLSGLQYDLYMKSPDGCESEMKGITVVNPTPVEVNTTNGKINDYDLKTGSISVTLANGSGQYTYELTDPDNNTMSATTSENNLLFSGLGTGVYHFKVKDHNNCLYFNDSHGLDTEWSTHNIDILRPLESLQLTITKKDINCNNSKDGNITFAAKGGWVYDGNDYQYRYQPENGIWSEWDTRKTFTISSPGKYIVELMDNEAVTRSAAVTIVQPEEFLLSDPQTKDATCRASSNGWVKISHTNGIDYADGLHYSITPDGSTTPIVEHNVSGDYYYGHLPKGYYTLTANDSHLCTASKSFAIGAPDTVQIISDFNYIRKKGESTGEIKATLSKGSEQYLYRWYKDEAVTPFQASTTSAGMLSITGQVAGKYRLEIKDTANCNYEGAEWMYRSFELKEPEKPLMLVADKNVPVDCSGEENGIIQLNAAGGWGDYLYRTAGGVYSPQAEYPGLKAGWYTFDVKDSAGIETQLTVEVVEPVPLTAALSRIDQVTCHDGNSGAITMNISGGNGGYEISSNNTDFKTGNVADQLIAGHYTVYIRDAKKCAISKSLYTITQPNAVSNVFNQITQSRCSNNEGAIEANFTGGTGALNYQWSLERFLEDNSHPIVELPQYTTPSISNLYSGKYYLKITDANDCPYNFDYFVSDITDLEISGIETDSVTCFGYSDGWAKASVIYGNPDPIKGYSYLWPDNRATIHEPFAKGFTAGEYILMVSDEKRCITIDTFAILTPDTLGYTLTSITEPLCLGGAKGSLSVNASGGTPLYQYQWAHGSTSNTITGLDPVAYELTITDSHACRATFGFPMSYQRTIKPILGADVNLCHYQTLPLDGGDFSRYNWQSSNGFTASSRNVTLKDPGTYYLSVTDADNCVGSDTLLMNVSYLKINNLTTSDVTCYGFGNGNASIEVVPADWPHSILWSNKKTIPAIDGLNGGKYNVVVNDGYGCTDSRDFVIQEPAQLSLSSRINDPLCLGVPNGQISLEATGGLGTHRFNWMDGNSSSRLTKLDKGTYSLTLSDENGCELNTFFTLNYQRTLFPELGSDRILCAGNEVKLYPGLFEGYQWMSNGATVSNDTSLVVSAPAEILVQVNDEDGCIATDGLSVTQTATTFTPAFLAASSVEVGDTLLLVEVSQPKPLSLKWSFTMPHRVVEETAYAIKVIFDEEGTGEMLLTAFNGDCQGESWKNLLVVSDSGNEAPKPGESNISSNFINFSAAPNPSDGHFNATIKMKEAVAVTLYLVNISTGQIAETRKVSGMTDYDEPFTIAGAGYYALFAESGGERRVVKIVVY